MTKAIAGQLSPSTKFHALANTAGHYIKFEDKDKALASVFWYMVHLIEKQQSVCIVLNDQKEAEHLNYLISRYELSPLCVVLSAKTPEINAHSLAKIKDAQASSTDYILKEEITAYTSYQDSLQKYTAFLKRLNQKITPGRTLRQVLDSEQISKRTDYQIPDHIGYPVTNLSEHQEVKDKLRVAQNLFQHSFTFLHHAFPFNPDMCTQLAPEELTEELEDLLDELNFLHGRFSELEHRIYGEVFDDYQKDLRKIKKEFKSIDQLQNEAQNSAGATVQEKLQFHFKKLGELCAVTLSPQDQESFNSLKYAIFDSEDYHKNKVQQSYNSVLASLHLQKNYASWCEDLLSNADQWIQKFYGLNYLKESPVPKAAQFEYQKNLLLSIKSRIENALFFLDNYKPYYQWRAFRSQLSLKENAILDTFINHSEDWLLDIDIMYLREQIKNAKLQMSSAAEIRDALLDDLDVFTRHHIKYVMMQSVEDATNPEKINISWENLLEDHASDIVDRFPILLLGRNVYVNNADAVAQAYDNTIFLNALPNQISILEDENHQFIASDDTLWEALINKLALKNSTQVAMIEGPYVSVNRPLAHMNRSELHKASMFLANQVDQLKVPARIFQLKDISVISFWSDHKNSLLLEALNGEGVKEIIPESGLTGILPAIFANSEHRSFVLIEDGIIDYHSAQENLIRQLYLISQLETAGIEIIDIDNVKSDINWDNIWKTIVNMDQTPQLVAEPS